MTILIPIIGSFVLGCCLGFWIKENETEIREKLEVIPKNEDQSY